MSRAARIAAAFTAAGGLLFALQATPAHAVSTAARPAGVVQPQSTCLDGLGWQHWDVYYYNSSNKLAAHGWAEVALTDNGAHVADMGIKDDLADGHYANLYVYSSLVASTEGHTAGYISRNSSQYDYPDRNEVSLKASAGSGSHTVYITCSS
jgi:hypothetical protein